MSKPNDRVLADLSDEFAEVHEKMRRLVAALDNSAIPKAQRYLLFDQLIGMTQYAKTLTARISLLQSPNKSADIT